MMTRELHLLLLAPIKAIDISGRYASAGMRALRHMISPPRYQIGIIWAPELRAIIDISFHYCEPGRTGRFMLSMSQ